MNNVVKNRVVAAIREASDAFEKNDPRGRVLSIIAGSFEADCDDVMAEELMAFLKRKAIVAKIAEMTRLPIHKMDIFGEPKVELTNAQKN